MGGGGGGGDGGVSPDLPHPFGGPDMGAARYDVSLTVASLD